MKLSLLFLFVLHLISLHSSGFLKNGTETIPPEPKGIVDLSIAKILTEEEKKQQKMEVDHIVVTQAGTDFVLVIQEADVKVRKEWASAIQSVIFPSLCFFFLFFFFFFFFFGELFCVLSGH